MNPRKLLARLLQGHLQNVSFRDMIRLVEGFGLRLSRVRGSHHMFARPDIPAQVNIQDDNGQAKPYQIRQFLRLIEEYDLRLED